MGYHYTKHPGLGADPEQWISDGYQIKDLVITATGIPNKIPDQYVGNLASLAELLDEVYRKIGAFTVVSAFRTSDLQEALNSAVRNTATGKSYHELGMAADIVPVSGDLDGFFGKILADPDLLNKMGEVAIKPSQGAVHLTLASGNTVGKVMTASADGKYTLLSTAAISDYISSAGDAFKEVGVALESVGIKPKYALWAMAVGMGLLVLQFVKRRRTHVA